MAIEKGESKRLCYLKKHQDVSLSAPAEFFRLPNRYLNRVPSEGNWSDILTKPLDHRLHWMGMKAMQVVALDTKHDVWAEEAAE